MDLVLTFVSALLRANRAEQDTFYFKQYPRGLFMSHEPEINWIYDYKERYKIYPSLSAFEQRFSCSLEETDLNCLIALQPILDQNTFHQMSKVVERTKAFLDKGESLERAVAFFKKEAASIDTYSVEATDSFFAKDHSIKARYGDRVRLRSEGTLSRLTVPWPTLRRLINYLSPGEIIVLAARTSLGKTWVCINMCAYLVARGVNCLFLSKEMPTEQVCDRFESLIFGLSYSRFRSGALSPKEMRLWSLKRHRLTNLPLIISGDETLEGVGFSYIISKIQQYKPEVVFVDGAYLLSPEKVLTRAPLVERLACISRQFKAIAKATKTVIIEVVQMNRLAESEEGIAKGSLITLYGSDTWGQDADWVMDISGVRGANTRRISLLKARESNIGSFMIKFILDPFPDFSELRRVSIEPEEIITFEGSG